MNAQFVILLILLLVILVYIYTEVETIKKNVDIKFTELNENIESNSKTLRTKIQTDLGTCTNKIKTYNVDILAQAKKITYLNSQPITSMVNNYTETDTEKKNMLQYLSDVKENAESCYMSETSTKTDFKITYGDLNSDKKLDKSIGKEVNDEKKCIDPEEKKDTLIEQADKIVANTAPVVENKADSEKNDSDENDSQDSDEDSDDSDEDSDEDNSYCTDENKTDSDEFGTVIENEDSESDVIEIDIDVKNIVEKEEKKSSDDNEKINLQSDKNETAIKTETNIVQIDDDNSSINTQEILTITNKTLKNMNEYTRRTLDHIAKVYSIPTTYKYRGKRVTYKKDELYDKIKNRIRNKK